VQPVLLDCEKFQSQATSLRIERCLPGSNAPVAGEWNETDVDEAAGTRQCYVEDCQVCCKPKVLCVSWEADAAEFMIYSELE